MSNNYGYQYQNGGYGATQQPLTPMMPQPGMPMGGQAWPPMQGQQQMPSSGPLLDDLDEDGFQMPRRLAMGATVPVTRCPNGAWAMSFVMNEREFHTIVYVQVQDGTFAPYHIEGIGALRIAPDATDGQAYMTRIPARSGNPMHVLHVPPEGSVPQEVPQS